MKARLLLKGLLWTVAACCALVVGLYLLALFINRNDEPEAPAVVRFENASRKLPPVDAADNGFIYFMGVSADKALDPAKVGSERIAWAQAQAAQQGAWPAQDFPGKIRSIDAARTSAIDQVFKTCRVADLACARLLKLNEAKIEEWVAREEWLAERYRKLRSYPAWRETLPYDFRIAAGPYTELLEAQRIFLLGAWLQAGRGDAAGVHSVLADDIRFWRSTIAHNDTLISKMISAAALQRHFTWSSVILRRLPAARQAEAIPAEWRIPISGAERSILRPLIGEWRYFNTNVRLAKAGEMPEEAATLPQHLATHFLQVQATSNMYAARMGTMSDLLSVGYEQMPAATRSSRSLQDSVGSGILQHGAYNWVGNALAGAGNWDMTKYALRAADLEGIRRVALVAAELRSRAVPSDQLQAQLAQSPGNPYDRTPFAWDEAAQSIVFNGLSEGKFGRTSVLY